MNADMLPPLFQILTGLSFAAILAIRFLAGSMLRPLWGKLTAFAVVLVALGSFIMSLATAKSTLSNAAEFIAYAGFSYFAAALLVVAGMFIAARQGAGTNP